MALVLALAVVLLCSVGVLAASPEQGAEIGIYAKAMYTVAGRYTVPVQKGEAELTTAQGITVRAAHIPEGFTTMVVTPIPSDEKETWAWIRGCLKYEAVSAYAFDIYFVDQSGTRNDAHGVPVTVSGLQFAAMPLTCSLTAQGQTDALTSNGNPSDVTFVTDGAPYYVLWEAAECPSQSFRDCPDTWYHEAVDFVLSNDLMIGVSKTSFAPKAVMTRGMMVMVLYRMAGSPAVERPCTFVDVPKNMWYYDAIAWAQENGIVRGVSLKKFAPDLPVTREQLAVILWRYEGECGSETDLSAFRDHTAIDAYAVPAVRWAVEKDLFIGDNGMLRPGDGARRAEFATIMLRFLGGAYKCPKLK